jgi:predicted DNA-binding transcriptional regulator YafY
MKINRLLEITLILLNKNTVTAAELADRFNVSTRTIYRDIDELSLAGVPIFTNKGNGGGITLLENYAINKALLTEYECDSILLALKTLQATKYPEIEAIPEKIGAVFKEAAVADWVHIEFSPWGTGPNEENKFLNIKKAILESSYDDYNQELITHNADGTYDVTVTSPEDEWVYGYIMCFGDRVEVLEPPHIREIIHERLQKALNFYQK